jgi:hypothetical protein
MANVQQVMVSDCGNRCLFIFKFNCRPLLSHGEGDSDGMYLEMVETDKSKGR